MFFLASQVWRLGGTLVVKWTVKYSLQRMEMRELGRLVVRLASM